MFERVLEIDPDYAPAYVELGLIASNQALLGWSPREEVLPVAFAALERAVSLDPEYAHAHSSLGATTVLQGDLAGAAKHIERALELDPTHQRVRMHAGRLVSSLGRFDEATVVFEYIRDRDPVDGLILLNLALNYYFAGRWEDAVATFRTLLDLSPEDGIAQFLLSLALLEMGEFEEALAIGESIESITSPFSRLLTSALAYYALGRQSEFERAFQELREVAGEAAPAYLAMLYAYTGEVDTAFEWLDRVTHEQQGAGLYTFFPLFTNLHDDPRWLAFQEGMGKSEEQLAAVSFEVRPPR